MAENLHCADPGHLMPEATMWRRGDHDQRCVHFLGQSSDLLCRKSIPDVEMPVVAATRLAEVCSDHRFLHRCVVVIHEGCGRNADIGKQSEWFTYRYDFQTDL
jgi:hypothetical protein